MVVVLTGKTPNQDVFHETERARDGSNPHRVHHTCPDSDRLLYGRIDPNRQECQQSTQAGKLSLMINGSPQLKS
jgi:hypothetical protein